VRLDTELSNENAKSNRRPVVNEEAYSIGSEIHQVVFLLSRVNSVEYYFDYGNSGDKTCIWINHEHDELPQLLIIRGYSVKHNEFRIQEYFSEYKDKFARIRTITSALMLLHNIKKYANTIVFGSSPGFYLSCGVCI